MAYRLLLICLLGTLVAGDVNFKTKYTKRESSHEKSDSISSSLISSLRKHMKEKRLMIHRKDSNHVQFKSLTGQIESKTEQSKVQQTKRSSKHKTKRHQLTNAMSTGGQQTIYHPTGINQATTIRYDPTGTYKPTGRRYHPTGTYQPTNTRIYPSKGTMPATTSIKTSNPSNPTSSISQTKDKERFVCNNGQKVLNIHVCDGTAHCEDGSDENDHSCKNVSNKAQCPSGQFPCENKRCVFKISLCNGVDDCGDKSDELDSLCNANATMTVEECADGQLVKGHNIFCDGIDDCLDKSDESDCDRCVGVPCPTGRCILPENLEYSAADCWGHNKPDPKLLEIFCQGSNVFLCDNNTKCLNIRKKCDGHNDCMDSSDEMKIKGRTQCDCGLFPCTNGTCISESDTCNGVNDCGDGSDESFFDAQCPNRNAKDCHNGIFITGKFHCKNGLCVDTSFVCNGQDDCGDNFDEYKCKAIKDKCTGTEFTCDNLKCINHNDVCDNHDDCGDNSDETSCSSPSSESNTTLIISICGGIIGVLSVTVTIILGIMRHHKKTLQRRLGIKDQEK